MKTLALTIVCALMLTACNTVTIRPKGGPKLATQPTYEASRPFFLFGLVGQEHVNVTQVCSGKSPMQMQTQSTFLDSFLGIVTLGIYTPKTAKVWCDGDQS